MVAGLDRYGKSCPHRRVKKGTGLIYREGTFRLLLLYLFYLAVFPEFVIFPAWMFAALMFKASLSRSVIYGSDCVEWQLVEKVTKDEHWQDVAFNLQRVSH
jgi:hypothetical protein